MTQAAEHITVLLHEAVEGLAIKPDGIYVDGTFGRGGHSRLILQHLGPNGRLIAIDRDPQAIAEAAKIQDLYLDGRKDEAAALVPDELLRLTNLCGPPDFVRERLAAV